MTNVAGSKLGALKRGDRQARDVSFCGGEESETLKKAKQGNRRSESVKREKCKVKGGVVQAWG